MEHSGRGEGGEGEGSGGEEGDSGSDDDLTPEEYEAAMARH